VQNVSDGWEDERRVDRGGAQRAARVPIPGFRMSFAVEKSIRLALFRDDRAND
jgi:hypothetical protein